MNKQPNDLPIMDASDDRIVLFYPNIPEGAVAEVTDTLRSRWIGQGPKVDRFESEFSTRFGEGRPAVAVGSGTDALHLAYILAGLQEGDEVVAPVFTCTATNIPFLYMGVKWRFADVQPDTLNIDPKHVRQLVNSKTRAIVCVHYGGLPCDMDELRAIADEWGIPIVEDAAHALGASYKGTPIGALSEFTMFSFQAIKHITTGDGGMLTIKDPGLLEKAKRVRWFGIDRSAKQKGIWENDITEVGYKYQMTDIGAAIGLASLKEFERNLAHRRALLVEYERGLKGIPGIRFIGDGKTDRVHAAWLCTVIAENRQGLQRMLYEKGIESGQVHYRNDRYSILGGRRGDLPNMDSIEDKYLVLPIHHRVTVDQVKFICDQVRAGW